MLDDVSLTLLAAADSYHVIVDRLPAADADPWIVWGTIASIGVALFTGILAWNTKRLADRTTTLSNETSKMAAETTALASETQQSIAVARAESLAQDRHHQEALSPIVVLKKPNVRFERQYPGVGGPQKLGGHLHIFSVLANEIKNIGFGPAFNLSLELRISGTPLSDCLPIPSLEVANPRAPEVHRFSLWSVESYRFEANSWVNASVLLTYENVFGQQRVTTYELTGFDKNGIKHQHVQ